MNQINENFQAQKRRKLKTIQENNSSNQQTIQKCVVTSPVQYIYKNSSKISKQKLSRNSYNKRKNSLYSFIQQQLFTQKKVLYHRRNKTQVSKVKKKIKDPISICLFVPFLQQRELKHSQLNQDFHQEDLKSKKNRKTKSFSLSKDKEKSIEKQKTLKKFSHKLQSKQQRKKQHKTVYFPKIQTKIKIKKKQYLDKHDSKIQDQLQTQKQMYNLKKADQQVLRNEKNGKQTQKYIKDFKLKNRQSKIANKNSNQREKQWAQINYLQLKTCYYYILKKLSINQNLNSLPSIQNSYSYHLICAKPIQKDKPIDHLKEKFKNLKVPKLPFSIQQVSLFIKQYQSIRQNKININDLIKSKLFTIKFIQNQFLYFGEALNDLYHGYGVYLQNQYLYQGQFRQNLKINGTEVKKTGIYQGEFINNERQGFGVHYWNDGFELYSGEWKDGYKHGNGIWKNINGDQYIGQWTTGKVYGFGVHKTSLSQNYEGYFIDFLKQGKGKQSFPNEDTYQGNFSQGKPNGLGFYKFKKTKSTYQGEFKDGLRQGKGKFMVPNVLLYQGQFKGDNVQGYGKLYYKNQDSYIGNFRKGLFHGKGSLHKIRQNRTYHGVWQNGNFFSKSQ